MGRLVSDRGCAGQLTAEFPPHYGGAMSSFDGFSKLGLAFLTELGSANKTWFDANRSQEATSGVLHRTKVEHRQGRRRTLPVV